MVRKLHVSPSGKYISGIKISAVPVSATVQQAAAEPQPSTWSSWPASGEHAGPVVYRTERTKTSFSVMRKL